MQKFLFLPRLRNRAVLEQAIQKGAGSRDFFATAYAQTGDSPRTETPSMAFRGHTPHPGVKFEGFQFGGSSVQFDATLLLIDPAFAQTYEANLPKPAPSVTPTTSGQLSVPVDPGSPSQPSTVQEPRTVAATKAKAFHGSAEVLPPRNASSKLPMRSSVNWLQIPTRLFKLPWRSTPTFHQALPITSVGRFQKTPKLSPSKTNLGSNSLLSFKAGRKHWTSNHNPDLCARY